MIREGFNLGECYLCSQGNVYICKSENTGNVFLACEECNSNSLGVRPEDKGKMSTIDDPAYLGDYKRPPGFDGADGTPGTMKKGAMFALDTDVLEQHGLVHDPDGEHHVSIKLLSGIPESELPERLAATRDQCEKVDPPEKKGDPEPDKKEGCAT